MVDNLHSTFALLCCGCISMAAQAENQKNKTEGIRPATSLHLKLQVPSVQSLASHTISIVFWATVF